MDYEIKKVSDPFYLKKGRALGEAVDVECVKIEIRDGFSTINTVCEVAEFESIKREFNRFSNINIQLFNSIKAISNGIIDFLNESDLECNWDTVPELYENHQLATEKFGLFSKEWYATKLALLLYSPDKTFESGFQCGQLYSEYLLKTDFESIALQGRVVEAARKKGQPKAVNANLKRGNKSHTEVLNAARDIYESEPYLKTQRSETARRIEDMKILALQKTDKTFLGFDAIYKHLSSGWKNGDLT